MADYYALLNVKSTATPEEIRAAYARERARSIAEEGSDEASLESRLRELDEAYAILNEPNQREVYDRSQPQGTSADVLDLAPISDSLTVANGGPTRSQGTCPHCGASNPWRATICVNCGEALSRPCPQCSQPVPYGQIVCPRCETVVGEYDRKIARDALDADQRVAKARWSEDAAKVVAEAEQRAQIWSTTVFWVVVAMVVVGLLALWAVTPALFGR